MAQARKLLVRALILAASAGAASAIYQRAAEARDRRRFPAPGRLVPVGDDRRLHLYQVGDGRPAVVIVPALNGSILEWLHIVREVQHDTLVCVYDRAGIGWSDPAPPGPSACRPSPAASRWPRCCSPPGTGTSPPTWARCP